MSEAGKGASFGLAAAGVIAGITLASILRGYLTAPPRDLFTIFIAMLGVLFICTYFWPAIPARTMQFLASCALGCLLVAEAVGR